MIQEKQLRSHQRLLRTFVNRTRQELNKLLTIRPNNKPEVDQWNHSKAMLTALLSGAEQTLAIVDFFLGDGRTVDENTRYGAAIGNVFNLYHLANAMHDNHDSFLVRIIDANHPTEADIEWAEDRKDAFNLIKQLIGKPNEQTTVEAILKYGAFNRPRAINLPDDNNSKPTYSRPIVDWQNMTAEQKRQAQAQLRRGVENDPSLGGFLEVCFGMPAGTLVSAASARQEQSSRVENVLNVIRGSAPQEPSLPTTTEPPLLRRSALADRGDGRRSCSPQQELTSDCEQSEVRIDLDEMADRVADEADGDEDVIGLDRLIEKAIGSYPELKQALTDPNSGYGIALVVSRR